MDSEWIVGRKEIMALGHWIYEVKSWKRFLEIVTMTEFYREGVRSTISATQRGERDESGTGG